MTPWRRQIQRIVSDPSTPVLPWLAPSVFFRPWPVEDGRRAASTEGADTQGKKRGVIRPRSPVRSRSSVVHDHPIKIVYNGSSQGPIQRSGSQSDQQRGQNKGTSLPLRSTHPSPGKQARTRQDSISGASGENTGHLQRNRRAGPSVLKRAEGPEKDEHAWYEAILDAGGVEDSSPATFIADASTARKRLEDELQEGTPHNFPAGVAMPSSLPVQRAGVLPHTRLLKPKDALDRRNALIRRQRRRNALQSRLNVVNGHNANVISESDRGQTKFVSIGRLQKVRFAGWTYPGSTSTAKYEFKVGDYSSTWLRAFARLSKDLSAVLEPRTLPRQQMLGRFWYNCITKYPKVITASKKLSWSNLRHRLWRDMSDTNRRNKLYGEIWPILEPPDDVEHSNLHTQNAQIRGNFLEEMRPSLGLHTRRGVQKAWEEALIYCLTYHPKQAPRFLQRTMSAPLPPRYQVAEALEYSISWADRHALTGTKWWLQTSNAIKSLTATQVRQPLPINGSILTTILRKIPASAVVSCVDGWKASGVRVTGDTILQAAQMLSQNDFPGQAVKLLDDHMESLIADTTREAHLSVVTSVLRDVSKTKDGLQVCQELVERLIQHGLVLDLQICNTIMLNAVLAGDPETPFNIYEMLKNTDVVPDKYTFAILAKGCKSPNVDQQKIARVIDDALRSGVLLTEPVVAGEVLHALYQHHLVKQRSDAFKHVVTAYEQLFKRSALEMLDIAGSGSQSRPSGPLQPGGQIIGIVIGAYLSSAQPTPMETISLYRRILHLARQGVKPFSSLFETDHVSNAFIFYFGSNVATIPVAMEVLRLLRLESTRDHLSVGEGSADAENKKAANAAGTDYANLFLQDSDLDGLSRITVNILHAMFAKHSHPSNNLFGPAERLLDFMCRNYPGAIEPKNFLEMVHAYLHHGDADGAEWCIEQITKRDFWDEFKGASIRRLIEDVRIRQEQAQQDGQAV